MFADITARLRPFCSGIWNLGFLFGFDFGGWRCWLRHRYSSLQQLRFGDDVADFVNAFVGRIDELPRDPKLAKGSERLDFFDERRDYGWLHRLRTYRDSMLRGELRCAASGGCCTGGSLGKH